MDIAAFMFPILLTLIFLGVPIAFALMSTAFIFGLMRFGDNAVNVFFYKVDEISGASVLAAVPLFIFMGAMLGVVVSDSLLMLFVFWELTSITSFAVLLSSLRWTVMKSAPPRSANKAASITFG